MDILQQCQAWHENEKYQEIVDALEAIPAEERTPEMDSELARAYNNLAAWDEVEMFRRAISLLEPHAEYFQGDHYWNFRMGYAYYFLEQEGIALNYFEQALAARPGDKDTLTFIDSCKEALSLPRFRQNFRERTANAWEAFIQLDAKLRQIIANYQLEELEEREREIIDQCDQVLRQAFAHISFEINFQGEKPELVLSPNGDLVSLFELAYFRRQAPAEVLANWHILLGRQPRKGSMLRVDNWEITDEDVQVWPYKLAEGRFGLDVYCEKLTPELARNENLVWTILTILPDHLVGEIACMKYIEVFDVQTAPKAEPGILLGQLPQRLEELGAQLPVDPEAYLESYTVYEFKPQEDPEADWRLDVLTGSTACPSIINGYLSGENDYMDELQANGATAGFLCYPINGLSSEEIFALRDALEAALRDNAGQEALTLIGGATGIYNGYVDFFAWDLPAVLDAAADFFAESGLAWADFHVFRRDCQTVRLWQQEESPQPEEE